MRHSTDRILVSHAGNLPRPDYINELIDGGKNRDGANSAEYAARLGSLIEAVNILGSLFYGTILGIFITAFYLKRVRGGTAFYAALVAELGVLACFKFTAISFLWYNLIGCVAVVALAWTFSFLQPPRPISEREPAG